MANYFDSEAYKVFKEELLAQTLPNQTEDPDNPNVLTYGDIFSSDGIEANLFAQQHFLNNLRRGGKDLENLATETNVDAGILRRSATQQLRRPDLQKLNEYVLSYSVQTTTPDLPKQRSQVPEYNLIPPTAMASMAGGSYPVLPTESVMAEVDRRDRELTEEEMIVLRRGGDITSDYYTIQDLSPSERYFGDKGFHAVPSKDSPSLMKSLVSLTYPTKEEAYELVKDEDPDAVFTYIDPRDITRGLLVRSPKTGNKLVPWRANIGPGLFPSTDSTFRSQLENIYGPALDGFVETTLRDVMPELTAGGAGFGLGFLLRKGAKRFNKVLSDKGPEGAIEALEKEGFGSRAMKGTAKVGGLFAATAIPVGLTRFAMLMHAKKEGIHPDLDIERAADDAGMIGMMAGVGALGGTLILRAMQNVSRRMTGKNIPEETVRRIEIRAEQMRREIEKPDTAEFSKAEIDEILQPYARDMGRRYSDTKTISELTQDEILQCLESDLPANLSVSEPASIAIQKMLLERGSTLQNFYEAMVINSGKNKGEMPSYDEFKAHFAKIAREQKEAALAAEREGIEALGPSQVLAGDEPVSEVADVIGEQVSTSSLFPDSRAKFFIMRDEQFQEANNALQNVLESDEALGMTTTALDKYIGSTIQKFMRGSGNTAPIRDLEGAEAAETIRDLIPMSDGRSILRTLMGVRERDELGRFISKPEFTFADLVNARINLGSLERSPNKTIRDYAVELKSGFDSAIDDLIRANRADGLKGELTAALNQIDEVSQNAIDGRVLRDIVSVDSYPEMARKMLSSSPREVNKLFSMLDELDLQEGNPGFRAEEVRSAILQQLRREVQDPELTIAQQNKKFRQILRDREEQLQQIFPEEKVADFKSFANFSKAAEADIAASGKRIRQLSRELEEIKSSPLEIIRQFLAADKTNFEEGATKDQLIKLSKLADEYPELRNSMQSVFSDYMKRALQGADYGEFFRGEVIYEPQGMNVANLLKLVQGYGGGKDATKLFGNDLSLILGKEMGQQYARNLRLLARELRNAQDRLSKRGLLGKNVTPDLGEESVGGLRVAMRATVAPLTQTGRRASLGLSLLGNQTQRYLLEVLVDPRKTEQLVKLANRQMSQREWARALGLIIANPSAQIGGERKDDAYDRVIDMITTGDDEDRDRILGGISEGLSMRDGGGVYNVLAEAEKRNRMLQRGRG